MARGEEPEHVLSPSSFLARSTDVSLVRGRHMLLVPATSEIYVDMEAATMQRGPTSARLRNPRVTVNTTILARNIVVGPVEHAFTLHISRMTALPRSISRNIEKTNFSSLMKEMLRCNNVMLLGRPDNEFRSTEAFFPRIEEYACKLKTFILL